jgi:ribosomal protein S18 acetylase RimI-like enzyme
MPDMLVKLYELPPLEPVLSQQRAVGVDIRRALAAEKQLVVDWVERTFNNTHWTSECEVAFSRQPVSCFIAVEKEEVVGFACHDTTYKNFFGPTGVDESQRGRGLGKALLLACLHAMAAQGYGYAIIGGVGPAEFYAKTVGAVEIEGSTPGIYKGVLHS